MSRLLLLSNSTMPGTPFFTWPVPFVNEFLADVVKEVLFIPYAAVTISFDEYAALVTTAFSKIDLRVQSIHLCSDPGKAVQYAQAIVVGGGNSFALLKRMYDYGLMDVVRTKVFEGTPYIGWSAGANLACPTIKTTNDMPIVSPPSFEALHFIPFQINPHYTEFKQEGHGGETRQQRIEEYLFMNAFPVMGLPEGMLLHREADSLHVRGIGASKLFRQDHEPLEIVANTSIDYLL